jgi:hypothetical protein
MSSATPIPFANFRHARCLFHPLREAVACCPHCGGTFCRECVTDEDYKLACPPCLRRLMRSPAAQPSAWRRWQQIFAGLAALWCLAWALCGLLRWRMNRPANHLVFSRMALGRAAEQGHE